MEKEKYERLLGLVTSKDKEKSEQLLSREASRGDLRMWGKVTVDAIGAGDWLVGSWSADGVPRWVPRMHYYSRQDRKFYFVWPNIAPAKMELTVDREDKGLDPERAKFIIENIETWERELQPVAPRPFPI
jgi:hypothetical protein